MMKCVFGLFLSMCLYGSCHADFVADLSLKKPWTVELENTQPAKPPFGAIFNQDANQGSKKLTYVAINPAKQAMSTALIESLIKSEKPEVILIQGQTINNIPHSQVKFKVGDAKIVVNGISCSREIILSRLALYGVSERDFEYYNLVNLMSQVWQFQLKSFDAVKTKAASYLSQDPRSKRLQLSYADFQKWFQEKMGKPFADSMIGDCDLVAPKDPKLASTNYLQKVSSYEDEVEDAYALNTLAKTLDSNQSVMIVRASSKYVMERDVLNKMLGMQKPSKVVSTDG